MLGPDEQIYLAQAKALRAGGIRALRDLAAEYVEEPTLAAYPSPLRWLWALLAAIGLPVSDRAVQWVSAALLGPVCWWATGSVAGSIWAAASPLALTLCRRRLQDVPVALAALVAIGAAAHHSPVGVATAVMVCLSLKEGAIFSLPAVAVAWLVTGGSLLHGALALAGGGLAWMLGLLLLFGRQAFAMFRAAAAGHKTQYAEQHQKGAPHRLLVDLLLASPAAVIAALCAAPHRPALAAIVFALIAAHAAAPIRNVRFIVAADVLLRALGAFALPMPLLILPLCLAIDATIAWRIRNVYDPVTHALETALGMRAASANR